MFVRNIDLALQRAEASYPREVWQAMTASERSAAIYRELRAMEAESINDGSYIPTRGAHRSPDHPDPATPTKARSHLFEHPPRQARQGGTCSNQYLSR